MAQQIMLERQRNCVVNWHETSLYQCTRFLSKLGANSTKWEKALSLK